MGASILPRRVSKVRRSLKQVSYGESLPCLYGARRGRRRAGERLRMQKARVARKARWHRRRFTYEYMDP